MNANFSKQAKRMPLWLVFVPYSPIFVLLYSMHKWKKLNLGWFNKYSIYAGICMVTIPTIFSVVFCAPLLKFAEEFDSFPILLFAIYLCWICTSIIIREVDFWNQKRLTNTK